MSYLELSDPATRLGKARSDPVNQFATAVEAAFALLPDPEDLQTNMVGYAVTTGASGNYSATVAPWPGALAEGMRCRVKCNHTNPAGGTTFTLNAFSFLPVRDNQGAELAAGMMVSGSIVTLTYVSGQWQLDQVAAIAIPSDGSVTTAKVVNGSISNNKLANMAESTIKGRAAGAGTGSATDLTASQARAALGGAYYLGNILGTVSQSGGVPTGAIIESGTGANGKFTRFASGLQVCHLGNLAVPYNSTADCLASWTFPAAFISAIDGELVVIPTLIPTLASSNTTGITNRANLGAPQVGALSTSACHVRVHRITGTTDFSSGQSLNVSLLAVGRWF